MNALPRYRPDIDGLRAVAVAAVVAYHAFPGLLPGGFAAVDVFFVISGFLISSILFESLARGRFDYREFYVRRIRRLFPALIVVLAATLLLAYAVGFPDELRRTGTEAFAGALFASNLLFLWQGAGYFGPGAELKPLLHLWSLGIEEQFYLAWPVTAVLLYRRPRWMWPAMLLLILASLAVSVAWSTGRANHAFYSPLSRLWELLAGAVLAHAAVLGGGLPQVSRRPRVAASMAALGALCVAAAFVGLDAADPFPGWRALLPVGGTVLLIAAGPATPVNALLSARGLVFVGLISYPLYLWHWPLLSFLRMHYGEATAAARLAVVALSVVLAWATFRFVESPVRFRAAAFGRPLRLAGVAAAVAAVALLARADALPQGFGERARFVRQFENSQPGYRYIREHGIAALYRLDCDFYDFLNAVPRASIAAACVTPATTRAVMIWGDSHAQSLAHGLRAALPADVSILQVATSGCRPDVEPVSPDAFGVCNRSNAFALRSIREARPDVVLLAQARDHEKTDWRRVARVVREAGAKQVILAGPLPQWEGDVHKIIARHHWDGPPRRMATSLHAATVRTDRLLRAAPHAGYAFVSLIERLCDADGCIVLVGRDLRDGLTTFDYAHLTREGSEAVGREILGPAIARVLGKGEAR